MPEQTSTLPDFNAIVLEYERLAEPATAAFGARALAMLGVRPGEHVIDIAAGTGALVLSLLETCARVTATDLSAPMVARIERRMVGCNGVARVEDGQALSFADQSFDAALSMFGIMLFPDFRAGLREMARVLRPGGRAVVGSWTGMTAPMRLLGDAAALAAPGRIAPTMPAGVDVLGHEQGMHAALHDVGLMDVRIQRVTLSWTSPPAADLLANPDEFSRTCRPSAR